MENKIWIELDRPKDKLHAIEQCRLANLMLARLGVDTNKDKFFASKRGYCFGGAFGYLELPDCGHWFSLDFLSGELDDKSRGG